MSTEWVPTTQPVIVASANKMTDGTLLIGVRHWDTLMRLQFRAKYGEHAFRNSRWYRILRVLRGLPKAPPMLGVEGQGFIDQFARWYDREEAMSIARQNFQIIVPDEQMLSLSHLHSEDLW